MFDRSMLRDAALAVLLGVPTLALAKPQPEPIRTDATAAEPLLLVSLVAAAITFLPYAVVPAVSGLVTTNDIAVAIGVLLITGTIWSFARHSRQRGWLR